MNSTLTFKAPESIVRQLTDLAKRLERPKSYLIRKALEQFLDEQMEDEEDYRIVMERLANDDPSKRISWEQIKRENGLED